MKDRCSLLDGWPEQEKGISWGWYCGFPHFLVKAVVFLSAGLARGENCFYLIDPRREEELVAVLKKFLRDAGVCRAEDFLPGRLSRCRLPPVREGGEGDALCKFLDGLVRREGGDGRCPLRVLVQADWFNLPFDFAASVRELPLAALLLHDISPLLAPQLGV